MSILDEIVQTKVIGSITPRIRYAFRRLSEIQIKSKRCSTFFRFLEIATAWRCRIDR